MNQEARVLRCICISGTSGASWNFFLNDGRMAKVSLSYASGLSFSACKRLNCPCAFISVTCAATITAILFSAPPFHLRWEEHPVFLSKFKKIVTMCFSAGAVQISSSLGYGIYQNLQAQDSLSNHFYGSLPSMRTPAKWFMLCSHTGSGLALTPCPPIPTSSYRPVLKCHTTPFQDALPRCLHGLNLLPKVGTAASMELLLPCPTLFVVLIGFLIWPVLYGSSSCLVCYWLHIPSALLPDGVFKYKHQGSILLTFHLGISYRSRGFMCFHQILEPTLFPLTMS